MRMAAFCKSYNCSPAEFRKCYDDEIDMLLIISKEANEFAKEKHEQEMRSKNARRNY